MSSDEVHKQSPVLKLSEFWHNSICQILRALQLAVDCIYSHREMMPLPFSFCTLLIYKLVALLLLLTIHLFLCLVTVNSEIISLVWKTSMKRPSRHCRKSGISIAAEASCFASIYGLFHVPFCICSDSARFTICSVHMPPFMRQCWSHRLAQFISLRGWGS